MLVGLFLMQVDAKDTPVLLTETLSQKSPLHV